MYKYLNASKSSKMESSLCNLRNDQGSDETDIDTAWTLKRYDQVLTLLSEDSKFPSGFNLKEIEDEDLKRFVEERNLLHDLIRMGQYQEVKEFTSRKKSKHFCNDKNFSAAFTAIKNRNFKIYAYLQSRGAGLLENEVDIMDSELYEEEKHKLRDMLLNYIGSNEKTPIYYLTSKTRFNSQELLGKAKDIIKSYEKLNENEFVSIILKVAQFAENLNLIFDLEMESLKLVHPSNSNLKKKSILRDTSKIWCGNTIFIGAGGSEKEMLGTIAHELTHAAMELVFKNNCQPYFKSNNANRNQFEILAAFIEEIFVKKKNTPSEVLLDAFDESFIAQEAELCELIARVPQIMVQYNDAATWLEEQIPELIMYYKDNVIPECEKLIEHGYLFKPRNLNRHMNETEGELTNLKKSTLFFKNIDKMELFLSKAKKNIFILIAEYTRLGLMKVLQGMYGFDYLEWYDHFLVLKLENLLKNIADVEYSFNLEGTDALIIECTDPIVKENAFLDGIRRIINIVKTKKNKKTVFIMKEEGNEYFMEILAKENLNGVSVKEKYEDFSVEDLEDFSRQKILDKTILFQEKILRLRDLINGEDLFKNVNAEIIQTIIDNKEIKIRNKRFGISSLESAYADVVQEINLVALIHEINFSNDIFLICGTKQVGYDQKKELFKSLKEEIEISIISELKNFERQVSYNKRVFLTSEEIADDDFKKFCGCNPEKKIYILKNKYKSAFQLLKFYNPNFYFKRSFQISQKIIINKAELELLNSKKISDVYLIIKDDKIKSSFHSAKIRVVDKKKIEKVFEEQVRLRKSVHVLKIENNELIWVKSHDSLSGRNTSEAGVDESNLLLKIINEKVTILAGDAGMGKSTTLTKLCDALINTHWVIRINLQDHLNVIKTMAEKIDMDHVKMILSQIDHGLKDSFSQKLLETALDKNGNFQKPLLIAFDGFDELLEDDGRQKIIALLKFLKDDTKCKILVTTRLKFEDILQKELSTLAMRLTPLNDHSKMVFIKLFLKEHLRLLLDYETFVSLFEKKNDWDKILMHRDIRSQHILHLALKNENDFVLNLIIETFSRYTLKERYELLKNADDNGQTVIHFAIAKKNHNALTRILDIVENLENEQQYKLYKKVDQFKRTIFHSAVAEDCDCALMLITEKARKFSLQQKLQILKMLDDNGCTVLDSAIKKGNKTAVGLINGMIGHPENVLDEKVQSRKGIYNDDNYSNYTKMKNTIYYLQVRRFPLENENVYQYLEEEQIQKEIAVLLNSNWKAPLKLKDTKDQLLLNGFRSVSNDLVFFHNTFREYFSAQFIMKLLSDDNYQLEVTNSNNEKFIFEILCSKENESIRRFIDFKLKSSDENSFLGNNNKDFSIVISLLSDIRFEKKRENAFRIAIKEGNYYLFNLLLIFYTLNENTYFIKTNNKDIVRQDVLQLAQKVESPVKGLILKKWIPNLDLYQQFTYFTLSNDDGKVVFVLFAQKDPLNESQEWSPKEKMFTQNEMYGFIFTQGQGVLHYLDCEESYNIVRDFFKKVEEWNLAKFIIENRINANWNKNKSVIHSKLVPVL